MKKYWKYLKKNVNVLKKTIKMLQHQFACKDNNILAIRAHWWKPLMQMSKCNVNINKFNT